MRRELAQLPADDLRHPPSDPGVDLVEDERAAARAFPARRDGPDRRAAAARARLPTRSSRAASPARPGSARRGRRASRAPTGPRASRRQRGLERDPEARLLHREPLELLLDGADENAAAAARRLARQRRRRRPVRLRRPPLRFLAPALERVLDVRELVPLLLQLRRGARGSPSTVAPYLLLERANCSRRVSIAVSRSGSASMPVGRVAGRGREVRDAALQVLGLVPSAASPRDRSRRAPRRPGQPRPGGRPPSPRPPTGRSGPSRPRRRIRSAWSSRPRSAGRSLLFRLPSGRRPRSRAIWKSSISSRASRGRRGRPRAPRAARAPRLHARPPPPRPPRAPPPSSRSRRGARARRPTSASSCSELCPWIATSRSPSRASVRTDAGSSSTNARPRPSGGELAAQQQVVAVGQARLREEPRTAASASNSPDTDNRGSPLRTSSDEPRPPARRASASTRIDLPASGLSGDDRQPADRARARGPRRSRGS